MVVSQPFVPLGTSGTVPDRFPPCPPTGGWWILGRRRYMRCFGPADVFFHVVTVFSLAKFSTMLVLTWLASAPPLRLFPS